MGVLDLYEIAKQCENGIEPKLNDRQAYELVFAKKSLGMPLTYGDYAGEVDIPPAQEVRKAIEKAIPCFL